MKLYCQGCGASFEDNPVNAFPTCCATCGWAQWATWKPGLAPISSAPITPVSLSASQPTLALHVWYPTSTAGAR